MHDATATPATNAAPPLASGPGAGNGSVPGLTPPSRSTGARRRLGDVVVELGFADRNAVEAVAVARQLRGCDLGPAL